MLVKKVTESSFEIPKPGELIEVTKFYVLGILVRKDVKIVARLNSLK